jgi:hypothetical protein
MQAADETVVFVQAEWHGWKTAEVRLRDIHDLHWHQPVHAPRPLAHGYVFCTDIVAGEVPHACERTPAPHRLLVCILKRHSAPSAYAEISRRADESRLAAI